MTISNTINHSKGNIGGFKCTALNSEVRKTDIHMREFDGTTFGMDADAKALRNLKKKAYYGEVKPSGRLLHVKRLCVPARYVAAAMGKAAWLVSEKHLMETIRWGDGPEYYIIYADEV